MILTEEQRFAIEMAIGLYDDEIRELVEGKYQMEGFEKNRAVLQAMIDSSGTVDYDGLRCESCGKTLTEIRGSKYAGDYCIGEIRLDPGQEASRSDPPIEPSWYFWCDECKNDSSDQFGKPTELIGGIDLEKGRATLEEAIDRMRMTVSDEDGFIWEADPEQTAILQEMLDRIGRYTNNDYLDLQYQLDSAEAEIERLRAMIYSSGTVEPAGGFDLEKAREVIDEAIDRMSQTVNDKDGPIWTADPEKASILQKIHDRIGICTGHDYLDLQYQLDSANAEIERLREALDESEQILAHKTKTATHWYEEGLKTRADLVQSKRVVEQQAARLKELESSLDEAEALTKKNADLMNAYLARIAELEDALVEGLTNFLHYRASCYDPARRCPYAKECDDCSTWDACGHVEKFRSEARQLLQAEGKIGPDAKPRSWQITEERIGLLEYCLETLLDAPDIEEIPGPGHSIEMLRAMLTEAGL